MPDDPAGAREERTLTINAPLRLKCAKHGEHSDYAEFSGDVFGMEIVGTAWCIHDIVEYLLKDGEKMESVKDG